MTSGRSQYSQEIINDSNKSSKTAYSSQKVEDLVAGSVPTNKAVLDKFSEDASNKLLWGGNPIEGGSSSIKLSEKTDNLIENLENQANPDDDGLYLKIDNKDVLDKLSENASGDLEYDGNPITGTTYTAGTNVSISSSNVISAKDTTKVFDFQTNHDYEEGEVIFDGNQIYRCTTSYTSTTSLAIDIDNWELINEYHTYSSKYVAFRPTASSFKTTATSWNVLNNLQRVEGQSSMIDTTSGKLIAPVDGLYMVNLIIGNRPSGNSKRRIAIIKGAWDANLKTAVAVSDSNIFTTNPTAMAVVHLKKNEYLTGYIYDETNGGSNSLPNVNSEFILLREDDNLINRPNTWPVNTEMDLGYGLYGMRFTGNMTLPAAKVDMQYRTTLTTALNSSTIHLMNIGGYWTRSTNATPTIGTMLQFDKGTGGETLRPVFSTITVNTTSVFMAIQDPVPFTNKPYDVWITYTK